MTTKAELLKVIRANCIDCVVGQITFIEDCGGEKSCKLFRYRFGVDPTPAKKGKGPTKEVRDKGLASALQARKNPSKIDDK